MSYTFTRLRRFGDSLFSVHEIEESPVLRAFYWVVIFGLFYSFQDWIFNPDMTASAVSNGRELCLPYLLDCAGLYPLDGFPVSYALPLLYSAFVLSMIAGSVCALKNRWSAALGLLLPALGWQLFVSFFQSGRVLVTFEFFHLPFAFVYLFSARKLYFLRRLLAMIYFFAAGVKLNDSWIVGTYFSSLRLGLPGVSGNFLPFVTNAVIPFEILGSWLLLSPNRRVRGPVVAAWLAFHAYSIALIGFRVPVRCIVLVLVLFTGDVPAEKPSFGKKTAIAWITIALIALANIFPHFTSWERRYTLQYLKFSISVFDANRQCVSQETRHYKDGSTDQHGDISLRGMVRCGPYPTWYRLQGQCKADANIERIEWKFMASINGGPFYKIVDVPDACAIGYSLAGNSWIQLPSEGAPAVGFPRKNYSLADVPNAIRVIFDSPDDVIAPTQEFFRDHQREIAAFWETLWVLTGLTVAFNAIRRKDHRV